MKSYEEVREAVNAGKTVRCNGSKAYKVIKDNLSQYFVVCETNGHLVGIKAYNYCDFYVEEGSGKIERKGVTRQGFGQLLKEGS